MKLSELHKIAGPITWEPNEGPQMAFMVEDARECLYGGAAGGGKQLRLDCPIPTPEGWTTVGCLDVGDELFDDRGKVCSVTNVFRVDTNPNAYRMTFDDGTSIECGADHKWVTFDAVELAALTRREDGFRKRRRNKRPSRTAGKEYGGGRGRNRRPDLAERNRSEAKMRRELIGLKQAPTGTVRTTEQIAGSIRAASGRSNHAIRLTESLDLPDRDLPIDPYLFGVWLGDGDRRRGYVTMSSYDWSEVAAFIEASGWKWGVIPSCPITRRIDGLTSALRRLGVLMNKRIPAPYLRASRQQRLALLRGLMDTDGTVTDSGSAEFCNTNRSIIDGVSELIVSLGWKATVREGVAVLNGVNCGPKWTIKWMASERVFRLSRKANKQKLASRRTTRFRYVIACDRCESVPMRCLSVDSPSHLFLAGKQMIPTHNSDALLIDAIRDRHSQWMRSIIFRKTFPEMKDLIRRSREIYPSAQARFRESTKEWFFPAGGIVEFAYLDAAKDRFNYQGRAFTFIGWDELTLWKDDVAYVYLMSRLRTSSAANGEVTLRVRATSNPGGIGHQWVKQRFDIPDEGTYVQQYVPDTDSWRVFIPARIKDNPYLGNTTYERDLDALPEHIRRMLKEGRWDVLEGVMFSEWDRRIHVCEPFAIPESARLWRACDDGFNAPACVLWFALIDGRVYIVGELYKPQLTAEELAEVVLKRDMQIPITSGGQDVKLNTVPLNGLIDPAAYSDHGIRRFRGGSRAKVMNEIGTQWRPAHTGPYSRVQGCNMVHEFLRTKLHDGLPKLQVFRNCANLIRTLPTLPIDEGNVEDVDTTAEDHPYDALRYGLQGVPEVIKARKLGGA